jgi:hypothetical protein
MVLNARKKPIARKPVKRGKTNAQTKADDKFQKLVRESGPCRARDIAWIEQTTYDGRTWRKELPRCSGNMQAAHVVTRSRHATRWRSRLLGDAYDGCIPLCAAHHMWQTAFRVDEAFFKACGVDYALVYAASLHDPPEKAVDALIRLKELSA